MACDNSSKKNCTCTYKSCSRHGKCCECIEYHISNQQLPGCCFPSDVEKTYDRSFAAFIECHTK